MVVVAGREDAKVVVGAERGDAKVVEAGREDAMVVAGAGEEETTSNEAEAIDPEADREEATAEATKKREEEVLLLFI